MTLHRPTIEEDIVRDASSLPAATRDSSAVGTDAARAGADELPDRRPAGRFSYLGRVVRSALGSELIPAFLRTRLLRRLGARMHPTSCIWAGCVLRSVDIELGSDVFINVGFFYDGAYRLTVEENVRIGQFVRVITATHEIGPSRQRCLVEATGAPVRIGRGCWVGAGVTLMPGVSIAPGCVVAAGAIVLESTEADGLYAGVPARRIRDLPTAADASAG